MDPIGLKQNIISVLQQFFKQDSRFTYNDDQDKTKIVIADIYGVDRKNTEQYPMIALARKNTKFQPVGLGNRDTMVWNAAAGAQPKETFGSLVAGGIVCHCLSYVGMEAELIGTKVANFLAMSKLDIAEIIKLKIDDVVMGEETHLKDWPTDLVDVPIHFNYIYSIRWTITDYATVMKNFTQTIDQKTA